MRPCPYCAEMIQDEAIKCRFCGSMLTGEAPGARPSPGRPPPQTQARRGWASMSTGSKVTSVIIVVALALAIGIGMATSKKECKQKFSVERAKIEGLPGYPSNLRVMDLNKVIGAEPSCETAECQRGPCSTCTWSFGGCSGYVNATVQRWGSPMEVRGGSKVYEIQFLEP